MCQSLLTILLPQLTDSTEQHHGAVVQAPFPPRTGHLPFLHWEVKGKCDLLPRRDMAGGVDTKM